MGTDVRRSILIVEDERIVALDLQQTLGSMGYDVIGIASSGDEAVARIAERPPELVLMDIRIKGNRDGIAVAATLREGFDLPVIYLTAHADEATLARAKATAPYAYLVKPVKHAELRSAIEITLYRHEMVARSRERERWFATTLHSIGDAVISVDLAGNVTFMNAAAEQLTGTTFAEAVGKPARDTLCLLDSDERTALESPFERALTARMPVPLREAILVARDQTRRQIGETAAPVLDGNQALGAVMVFRDLTQEKLVRQQLEIANRLSSLGTMAAGVAHEINNPLAVVLATSECLVGDLAAVRAELTGGQMPSVDSRLADAISAVAEIESASRRIARIVADLKTFSRPSPTPADGADIVRVIESAVRATAHELKFRAQLVVDLQGLRKVRGDETRLGQVFVNLLINAAQAIAPGHADLNQVIVTGRQVDETVQVTVRDTGPGIPAHIMPHIFDPFFTTKDVGQGTGLGLSICHGIVQAIGGKLAVQTELGRGTSFTVTIPIAPPVLPASPGTGSVQAAGVMSSASIHATTRARVLVIDDEPFVHRALARILRPHELIHAMNGREALELVERGALFDAILSDVMMPTMTGIELYERLLARHPDLARRIVFVTGGATTAAIEEFLRTVPNVVIEKPFGAAEIVPAIERLLV